MSDSQRSTGPGPECLTRYRTRRYHGTVLAGVVALAVVGTVGGAARAAEPSAATGLTASTAYLTTNAASVASTVDGGVVDIVSQEKYANATAAGTGMVLTSTGEILTNNHVVDGATSITVTVVSTGRSYRATVVGTDPTQDVAVLQLSGASGLRTIPIGDSSAVAVGQSVTASGNAGGTGGTPSSVTGSVVALDQSITASDGGGGNAEQLTGLIETDAPIVAGDSGGPLASSGTVIGMDTAASASNEQVAYGSSASYTATSQGYAIPIATALTIAQKIESGQASSTIHLGVHGFLGIELASDSSTAQGGGSQFGGSSSGDGSSYGGSYGSYGGFGGFGGYSSDGSSSTSATTVSGVTIAGVVSGGAAEQAGLTAGDVITAVGGHSVGSATRLDSLMASTTAGQRITIAWTDSSGGSHTGTATLDTAPVD